MLSVILVHSSRCKREFVVTELVVSGTLCKSLVTVTLALMKSIEALRLCAQRLKRFLQPPSDKNLLLLRKSTFMPADLQKVTAAASNTHRSELKAQ